MSQLMAVRSRAPGRSGEHEQESARRGPVAASDVVEAFGAEQGEGSREDEQGSQLGRRQRAEPAVLLHERFTETPTGCGRASR